MITEFSDFSILSYIPSGGEGMSEPETTKKCVCCGINLSEVTPSKFDNNYCEYCQDQETGSFEKSKYANVRYFVVKDFFMNLKGMEKEAAEENAVALIKNNPFVLLNMPCTP